MDAPCILVVDDHRNNREALAELLREDGYRTELAADAGSARERLSSSPIALVLLDVGLPGMSGLELLEELRHTRSPVELPVIMVTAAADSGAVVAALQRGASDYVTKPVDFDVLMARVRTQLELCRLSRLKDEFLRIASHDLKNPLTAVQFGADSLQEAFPEGATVDGEAREYFAVIRQSAQKMRQIISDFLDLGALRDGKLHLDAAPVGLRQLAAHALDDNSVYALSKSIRLTLLDGPSPSVRGDAARLSQVLDNLVGNAIKFTPRGGSVEVALEDLRLEVRDSGPGLGDGDLERLFTPHGRGQSRPTGGESSTGLGLALCKQLIELMGGRVGAKNGDRGAIFWFELPRA